MIAATASPLPARTVPTRAVAAWILYDLANTIFSMGVVSMYFSLYVRDAVGADRADSLYSLIFAVSMGLIFVVSPLLGAMTDRAPRRMPFLVATTVTCCVITSLFARGPFALSAVLFILANAAYQAGVQFYDALLPEVTTPENRGRIGGLGIGIGYLGSYIAVGLGFIPHVSYATLFTLIAIAFCIFALPCFFFVAERGNPRARRVFSLDAIRDSTRDTVRTLRSGREHPGLLRFLLGRLFYTDAINTVIAYMTLYAVNVSVASGLTEAAGMAKAKLVMFSAITCAIAGGIIWGYVVDRRGPKKTLTRVMQLWVVTFSLGAAVGFWHLPIAWLFVVACLSGIAIGGTWTADRPLMLRLTPPDRVGEFYGLYGMVGRFSAITGPVLWGLTTRIASARGASILTGEALAIVMLLLMVIAGMVILRPVTDVR